MPLKGSTAACFYWESYAMNFHQVDKDIILNTAVVQWNSCAKYGSISCVTNSVQDHF